MSVSRVEKLRQMGISFGRAPGKSAERRQLWRKCNEFYRAAVERIDQRAKHVDEVNALMPVPFERLELSETFGKREPDLLLAIDLEWLSDALDIEEFCRLVTEWEKIWIVELDSWMEKLRSIE